MDKFIPITTLDSKRWTDEQTKRVWRINAAAIGYFAEHADSFNYHLQDDQDCFFAICRYFLTHPLIDEPAPDPPTDPEKQSRQVELDEYVASRCK